VLSMREARDLIPSVNTFGRVHCTLVLNTGLTLARQVLYYLSHA
jgi:hypothetical protein